MPRIARVVALDYPHHITQRGNYKQPTFIEDKDYSVYLQWLNDYCVKYKLDILAYCLMPNHVHFIAIPRSEESLAKTFNTCHMRYSQYFNKKNNMRGHLWQGRFYSSILSEPHLYAAVRYIENNPVRAKLVKSPQDWKWSSAKSRLRIDKEGLQLIDISKYIQIDDWGKYLAEREDKNIVENIKANTLTGRPSGDKFFVLKLEKLFSKRLSPLPIGRPRRK